jgi:sugar (pentulose or hexulose) kinase
MKLSPMMDMLRVIVCVTRSFVTYGILGVKLLEERLRYLGIDVGTTAVKAAVFEPDGTQVSHASVNVKTYSPNTGWSEQSMPVIWQHVCEVVNEAASVAGSETVHSIGVAGQGDGLWALDKNLQPVRPAILWNDQRASEIVNEWMRDGTSDLVANSCRTAIWPGTSGAAYAWLQAHEPENAQKIAYICHAKDWIGLQLTGALATDYSDATIPFLDLNQRRWSSEVLSRCSATAIEDALPIPRLATDTLGPLTQNAADAVGLSSGIAVAVGTLDLAAMHIGAGLNEPGNGLVILGTTAVLSTVSDPTPPPDDIVGATVMHPDGQRWLNVQAPQSGSSALDWLAQTHPDTYPNGASDVAAAAEHSPAGANGVIFQPYLTGERAPFVAPDASGALLGLTARTTGGIARKPLAQRQPALQSPGAARAAHCGDRSLPTR